MQRKLETVIEREIICDSSQKTAMGQEPFCPYFAKPEIRGIACPHIGTQIYSSFYECRAPDSRLREIAIEIYK